MAIIQISKIQQRSGNLVDLPQLDEAQFGFAQDASRLFIGKTTGTPENIEVLTSYSEISFSQVQGSGNSNVNITSNTLHFGQILGYDSNLNSWVNTGGNANDAGNANAYTGIPVHLGSVSNVKIGGGAIGYVLTTDGSGTLSWSPKTTVIANILAISNASPAIMTFNPNIVSYVSGTAITILGVTGNSSANANLLNGNTFYVKVANDFNTTGDVSLYISDALDAPNAYNGAGIVYDNPANIFATATSSFGVSGSSPAAGVDGSIQFNVSGVLTGSSLLKYANSNVEIANSSVVISNGNVSANLLTGTLTTNAQPNITSTGTLAGLVVAGNITPNTDITYNLGNNTNRFNDLYLANSTIYIGSQTISANATNVIISGILTANISGNISGNATTAGTVTTNAQPNITSVGILTSLSVSGNITTGNLDGANSITGNYFIGSGNNLSNIQGANVSGAVSFATTANSVALANVSGAGNIASINLDGSTSNVLYGNGVFAPAAATYGNSDVATFLASFGNNTITTTGNVSVGNIIGNGQALTGIAGANVSGFVPNANVANTAFAVALGNVSGAGNIASINLDGSTSNVLYGNGVFAPAAVSYGNSNVATFLASFGSNTITTTGTITSGNANLGNLVVANFFSGDGSLLTNLNIVAGSAITNGNSNVTVAANSNVSISVAGTTGVVVVTNTSANVTGNLSVTGNITAGNISASLFTGNVSGNGSALSAITGANVTGTVPLATSAGTVTTAAQPNITSTGTLASLSVTGNVSAGNFIGTGGGSPTISSAGSLSISATSGVTINNIVLLSTGSNSTAGNITGNFTLTAGSRLQATYADLAEYYEADAVYEPGTILEFGGDKEVTIAEDSTTRVAGVVSTNPAYAMNANCQGIATAIALQGRVPTKVRGTICKGDMMVSAGNGFAKPSSSPQMGTVIGKALENFDGVEGIIEIAVGRL